MSNDHFENEIFGFLKQEKSASADEIARRLFISPSSVRRKLKKLEEKGLVRRMHGKAVLNEQGGTFSSFTFRYHTNSFQKKQIALRAISLIKDGDVIFIDESSTSYFIAEYLSEFENVTVLTNSIDTFSLLAQKGIKVYSTGGEADPQDASRLIGGFALHTIKNMRADIYFLSATGINEYGEMYNDNENSLMIKKEMLAHAKKKVFLCDSSKLGASAPFKLASLSEIDYLISDKNIREFFRLEKLPELLY